jgi:hypothetical protein
LPTRNDLFGAEAEPAQFLRSVVVIHFKETVMRKYGWTSACVVLSAVLVGPVFVVTGGCGPTVDKKEGTAGGHPTKGPHGGGLIELGNEEYHAEMIHDDAAGTVTFYVLDGSATKQVPIDATEVVVNLKHDGKPEQFKIPAASDTTDPAGKSSRFVSKDKELAEDLDAKNNDAELVLTIGTKQFRGKLKHEH